MTEHTIQQSVLSFRFDTDLSQISAKTLAETLGKLGEIFAVVNEECYPDVTCNLKVTAHRPGSFIIDIITLAAITPLLFTPDNVQYAHLMISMVKNCFDIKKHIGNEAAKKIEDTDTGISVTNALGELKAFPRESRKFFESPKIEAEVVNIICIAENNSEVHGIALKVQDGLETVIPRTEFNSMNKLTVNEPKHKELTTTSIATYIVKQATLVGNEKWKLIMDKTISVKINDDEWLSAYRDRKHEVLPGDSLKVEINTTVSVDDFGMPIEGAEATYEVQKVLEIIKPPEQMMLE